MTPTRQPGSSRFALLTNFSGLLPPLSALPFLLLGLWSAAVIIYLAVSVAMVGLLLTQHKRIGALDVLALLLGIALAVAYFGFRNTLLLRHYGIVLNTLLLLEVVHGEITGTPWTAQYAKSMVAPNVWRTKAFFEGNRFVSRMWGAVFLVSIVTSVVGRTPLLLYVLPSALLVAAALLTRRAAVWWGMRFAEPAPTD